MMGANKGDWIEIEIDLGGSVQRGHLAEEMLQYGVRKGGESLGAASAKRAFCDGLVQRLMMDFPSLVAGVSESTVAS